MLFNRTITICVVTGKCTVVDVRNETATLHFVKESTHWSQIPNLALVFITCHLYLIAWCSVYRAILLS